MQLIERENEDMTNGVVTYFFVTKSGKSRGKGIELDDDPAERENDMQTNVK